MLQVWDVTAFVGRPAHDPNTGEKQASNKEAKDDEENQEDEDMQIVIPVLVHKMDVGGINFCRLSWLRG